MCNGVMEGLVIPEIIMPIIFGIKNYVTKTKQLSMDVVCMFETN